MTDFPRPEEDATPESHAARGAIEVYRRDDTKWAWRIRARNGQIIATDGGQGYENKQDAVDTALSVTTQYTTTAWFVVTDPERI